MHATGRSLSLSGACKTASAQQELLRKIMEYMRQGGRDVGGFVRKAADKARRAPVVGDVFDTASRASVIAKRWKDNPTIIPGEAVEITDKALQENMRTLGAELGMQTDARMPYEAAKFYSKLIALRAATRMGTFKDMLVDIAKGARKNQDS